MDNNYKVNVNINKLRNEVQTREYRKVNTFEQILNMCYQKILSANKTSCEYCCIFVCPHVVFGLPLYNLIECITFIMYKLNEKGFETHLSLPNNIYISWKPKHITKNQYLLQPPPQQQKQYRAIEDYPL